MSSATPNHEPNLSDWPNVARAYVGQARDIKSVERARHNIQCARLLLALKVEDFDLCDQLEAELERKRQRITYGEPGERYRTHCRQCFEM